MFVRAQALPSTSSAVGRVCSLPHVVGGTRLGCEAAGKLIEPGHLSTLITSMTVMTVRW